MEEQREIIPVPPNITISLGVLQFECGEEIFL